MSDLRKAAQQALEALEGDYRHAVRDDAIDALRAALAQPEPEPVAWMFQHEETGRTMCVDSQQVEWGFEKGNPRLKKIWPLYTTPHQRKPLTETDIKGIVDLGLQTWKLSESTVEFARAIERAHGIGGKK